MESISPECTELKVRYDECFHEWYRTKYLKGDTRDTCQALFAPYQACVKKALQAKDIDISSVNLDPSKASELESAAQQK